MCRIDYVVLLAGALLLLNGCVPNKKEDSSTSTTINSYTLTGTSANVGGVAPLNPGVNSGVFSVDWNVSSSDPYHTRLYVSEDDVLSKGSDVDFFGKNCGSPSPSTYDCDRVGAFSCSFDGSNIIECDDGVQSKNLTIFLDMIPKDAYIILEACNGLFDSCKNSSVSVQFQ